MSQCHSCGYELCFDCSRPFHGRKTCQDAEEDEITKWARNHDTAKCPQCKVTIERKFVVTSSFFCLFLILFNNSVASVVTT
jgi:hypothetical protein